MQGVDREPRRSEEERQADEVGGIEERPTDDAAQSASAHTFAGSGGRGDDTGGLRAHGATVSGSAAELNGPRRIWVTPAGIAALLGAAFLWAKFLAAPAGDARLEAAWRAGAKIPEMVEGGQLWRLVTAPLHHLDVTHLAVNAGLAALLAALAVRVLGHAWTWTAFLLGAWLSTGASFLWNPAWSLGASGGGYALVGALLGAGLLHPRLATPRNRALLGGIAGLLALQIASAGPSTDRVAHLAGLLTGLAVGLLGVLLPRVPLGRPLAVVTIAALAWAEPRCAATAFGLDRLDALVRGPDWMIAVPSAWVAAPPLVPDVPMACFSSGLATLCVVPPLAGPEESPGSGEQTGSGVLPSGDPKAPGLLPSGEPKALGLQPSGDHTASGVLPSGDASPPDPLRAVAAAWGGLTVENTADLASLADLAGGLDVPFEAPPEPVTGARRRAWALGGSAWPLVVLQTSLGREIGGGIADEVLDAIRESAWVTGAAGE